MKLAAVKKQKTFLIGSVRLHIDIQFVGTMLKINNLNLFVPVMADAETVTEIAEMVISTGKQAGTVGLFFFQTRLLRCLIHKSSSCHDKIPVFYHTK